MFDEKGKQGGEIINQLDSQNDSQGRRGLKWIIDGKMEYSEMASDVFPVDDDQIFHLCSHLPDPSFQMASHRYLSNLITGIINAIFAPFAVIANFLVFVAILRSPTLRCTPSCMLIACLALSDFLVGVIVQPAYLAYRLRENQYGYVNCAVRLLYANGFYICYGVSFMSLSTISFERYLALRLHLRYKCLVTVRRVLIFVVFIWFLNVALTSLQWARIIKIARGTSLFFWFMSLFIAGISQFGIHRIVRRHCRDIERHQRLSAGNQNFRIQVRLAVSVAYIVGIYFFFNLPVLVVTTYHQIATGHIDSYDYYSWSETIAFLNSFINPMVCCWRSQDIRKAIKKMLPARLL